MGGRSNAIELLLPMWKQGWIQEGQLMGLWGGGVNKDTKNWKVDMGETGSSRF
jgi:hypothetical protein